MDVDGGDGPTGPGRSIISDLLEDDAGGPELTPSLRRFMTRSGATPGRESPPPVAEPAGEPEAAAGMEDLPSLEKLSLLPQPGDPYLAHSRPVPKGLPMLCLLEQGGTPTVLSYGDLRWMTIVPGEAGKGPALVLRFIGVAEVRVEGRHVDRLVGYLYLHRLAWLRELPAGKMIRDPSAVVITAIVITEAGE